MNAEETNRQGGPAFPVSIPGCGDNGWHGMTLRDYFAAQVVSGMFGRDGFGIVRMKQHAEVAAAAYEQADAMLRARAKTDK